MPPCALLMLRILLLVYGLVAYATFFASLVYLVGFLADVGVPRSVDAGGPPTPVAAAVAIDLGLLVLFGMQHSGMARRRFKEWWERRWPVMLVRPTFVLATGIGLGLLYWQWRPLPAVVWSVSPGLGHALAWGTFAAGWALALLVVLVIDHFDVSGLEQVIAHARGRHRPESEPFPAVLLYRFIRHPLQLGWLMAFWSTPVMTAGHLLFAAGMTVYILIALRLAERDMLVQYGRAYRAYRRRVPMLLPRLGGWRSRGGGDRMVD